MFGLGSSKRSGPAAVWSVQLLTTGYLVEGSLQAKDYEAGGRDIFALAADGIADEGGIDAFQGLRLTAAHVRPIGNSTAPEQTFSEWGLLTLDEVIAIIPRDAAGLESAQKAFKDYRHPLEVMVFAGPYQIRARLMSDSANRKRSPFAMTQVIPLAEAQIECPVPGSQLATLAAPWLLLNGTAALHGYGIP